MNGFTRASASLWLLAVAANAVAQTPAPPALAATARVAYFEVAPSDVGRAITLLKTYREAVRSAPGVIGIEVLQQIGRPNLFAIADTWRDEGSLQTYLASAVARKFRDDVERSLISPFDERLLAPVAVQAARGAAPNDAIYVLTHADSVDRTGVVPRLLQELAAAARQESGNVRFDVTLQPNRTNHFTLVEVWNDQKAYEAHATAADTRKFRMAFGPVSGALYDERIYKALN